MADQEFVTPDDAIRNNVISELMRYNELDKIVTTTAFYLTDLTRISATKPSSRFAVSKPTLFESNGSCGGN